MHFENEAKRNLLHNKILDMDKKLSTTKVSHKN